LTPSSPWVEKFSILKSKIQQRVRLRRDNVIVERSKSTLNHPSLPLSLKNWWQTGGITRNPDEVSSQRAEAPEGRSRFRAVQRASTSEPEYLLSGDLSALR